MLEIGCFEGQSSVFFADHFLDHDRSTLTCVDPFLTIEDNDHIDFLQNQEEIHFDYNLSICKHAKKIVVNKITSDAFFESLDPETRYHFIYIDGCHKPDFIKRDMENSFRVLHTGGVMWMDDYRGGDGIQIKRSMDHFLETYAGRYILLHSGYQLAIQKR
jgi:predicted O-methyltransferase YrrM